MSWHQDDGKRPVYRTTRGARGAGSNWTFLLPVELAGLLVTAIRRRSSR